MVLKKVFRKLRKALQGEVAKPQQQQLPPPTSNADAASCTAAAGGALLGVNVGELSSRPWRPSEVSSTIRALQQQQPKTDTPSLSYRGVQAVKLFDTNVKTYSHYLQQDHISAVMVAVPNHEVLRIRGGKGWTNWVEDHIQLPKPEMAPKLTICVGNEVLSHQNRGRFVSILVKNLRGLREALDVAGHPLVKVTTPLDMSIMGMSYPPSRGEFDSSVLEVMQGVVAFLYEEKAKQRGSPFLINIYPYFALGPDVSVEYATFRNGGQGYDDQGTRYTDLMSGMYDAVVAAVRRVREGQEGGGATREEADDSLEVVVGETGWPTRGAKHATAENAAAFTRGVLQWARERSVSMYLFQMADGNRKEGLETERHFGLLNERGNKFERGGC